MAVTGGVFDAPGRLTTCMLPAYADAMQGQVSARPIFIWSLASMLLVVLCDGFTNALLLL